MVFMYLQGIVGSYDTRMRRHIDLYYTSTIEKEIFKSHIIQPNYAELTVSHVQCHFQGIGGLPMSKNTSEVERTGSYQPRITEVSLSQPSEKQRRMKVHRVTAPNIAKVGGAQMTEHVTLIIVNMFQIVSYHVFVLKCYAFVYILVNYYFSCESYLI